MTRKRCADEQLTKEKLDVRDGSPKVEDGNDSDGNGDPVQPNHLGASGDSRAADEETLRCRRRLKIVRRTSGSDSVALPSAPHGSEEEAKECPSKRRPLLDNEGEKERSTDNVNKQTTLLSTATFEASKTTGTEAATDPVPSDVTTTEESHECKAKEDAALRNEKDSLIPKGCFSSYASSSTFQRVAEEGKDVSSFVQGSSPRLSATDQSSSPAAAEPQSCSSILSTSVGPFPSTAASLFSSSSSLFSSFGSGVLRHPSSCVGGATGGNGPDGRVDDDDRVEGEGEDEPTLPIVDNGEENEETVFQEPLVELKKFYLKPGNEKAKWHSCGQGRLRLLTPKQESTRGANDDAEKRQDAKGEEGSPKPQSGLKPGAGSLRPRLVVRRQGVNTILLNSNVDFSERWDRIETNTKFGLRFIGLSQDPLPLPANNATGDGESAATSAVRGSPKSSNSEDEDAASAKRSTSPPLLLVPHCVLLCSADRRDALSAEVAKIVASKE